ncbi:MAG: HEAT repeat domain-containing protein, partial [Candidatus Aramenus sp.]|nr:HEAT repeat domain-containing protein [Candidatus Aramenus sp.]
LEKGVKSEVENVRATSARVLWRFKDPRVREVLTAMLKDPSTAVRTSVVTSLGELKDKGLLSQVVNNEDEDQRVRATALRLLRSIEGSQ